MRIFTVSERPAQIGAVLQPHDRVNPIPGFLHAQTSTPAIEKLQAILEVPVSHAGKQVQLTAVARDDLIAKLRIQDEGFCFDLGVVKSDEVRRRLFIREVRVDQKEQLRER